jgi:hypothetical protein
VKYLIYTTEEGGMFKFGYPDRYEEALATGLLDVTPAHVDAGGRGKDFERWYYIALVEPVADFDRVLGRSRIPEAV